MLNNMFAAMRPCRLMGLPVVFVLALALTSLPAGDPPPYQGIRFKATEYAPNGKTYAVAPGVRGVVDANSDVRIDLQPLRESSAIDNEEWINFLSKGEQLEVTVQGFHDAAKGGKTVLHIGGYDNLPLGELRSLWYDPTVMPGVRVELDKTKWDLGDRITLVVRVRKVGELGDLFARAFRVEAGLTGLHPLFGTGLIFARGIKGSDAATSWKTNVMAQINWFNNVRDPGRFGAIWNWLGMGAGLHLASLDMGDDSVEFGLGANIALWRGLFSVGYGYNLNVPDDVAEYKFIALDLFHVLNGKN